jgi:Fe2+ or Zn2+ uptake regulation protein
MLPELEQFIGKRAIRRIVVETALHAHGVFSADELYAKTRLRQPTIGRATIYRTLRLLCDRKLFREIVLHNGVRVYQRNDESKRVLWVCDDCSFICALSADEVYDSLRMMGERAGLKPAEMTIEVRSRCQRSVNQACPIADRTNL